jgi:hypothetical protein
MINMENRIAGAEMSKITSKLLDWADKFEPFMEGAQLAGFFALGAAAVTGSVTVMSLGAVVAPAVLSAAAAGAVVGGVVGTLAGFIAHSMSPTTDGVRQTVLGGVVATAALSLGLYALTPEPQPDSKALPGAGVSQKFNARGNAPAPVPPASAPRPAPDAPGFII